jgi:hypothetical protein
MVDIDSAPGAGRLDNHYYGEHIGNQRQQYLIKPRDDVSVPKQVPNSEPFTYQDEEKLWRNIIYDGSVP